jgi:hypothetical protein
MLLAVLGLSACIERPASPRERRDRFERNGLTDVLLTSAPSFPKRVGANFDNAAELMGLEVDPPVPHAGDTVKITYYFRAMEEADEDYKVFVHVDDRAGHGDRINADHWPANGHYPTSVWHRNDIIKDVWTFKIPGYYQGDALDLWTGFYQPGKDERWPVVNKNEVQNDGQNRVLSVTVPVARQ